MNTIVRYPKEYSPPVGISPQSVLLKGPKDWQEEIAKELALKFYELTLILADDTFSEYDIKHAQEAEIVLINWKGLDADNAHLFSITHQSKFPPLVYAYIDGRASKADILKVLAEISNVNLVKSVEDLLKNTISAFSYLTDRQVPGKIEASKKRGRPKKKQEN